MFESRITLHVKCCTKLSAQGCNVLSVVLIMVKWQSGIGSFEEMLLGLSLTSSLSHRSVIELSRRGW